MSEKPLQTLEAFNGERLEEHRLLLDMAQPHRNGIACPKCSQELWDSNPMVTLTSYPAQKHVHCPACGYRGYRLA